jgi:hypothetical protein
MVIMGASELCPGGSGAAYDAPSGRRDASGTTSIRLRRSEKVDAHGLDTSAV